MYMYIKWVGTYKIGINLFIIGKWKSVCFLCRFLQT